MPITLPELPGEARHLGRGEEEQTCKIVRSVRTIFLSILVHFAAYNENLVVYPPVLGTLNIFFGLPSPK